MYVHSNNKTNIAPIPINIANIAALQNKNSWKKNKWPRLPSVYKVYEPTKKSFKNNYVNTKNIKIT